MELSTLHQLEQHIGTAKASGLSFAFLEKALERFRRTVYFPHPDFPHFAEHCALQEAVRACRHARAREGLTEAQLHMASWYAVHTLRHDFQLNTCAIKKPQSSL